MSYHGSSLALSPMTPSWQAWIKLEARTHLNVRQIFTSKTHPRPYFLHFVQHMSNCSTKKSPVIRTDNQRTEAHLDTKKFTIPLFNFLLFSSSHFWWMPAFKERQVLSRGILQPAWNAQGGRSGSGDSGHSEWLPWLSVLRIRFHFTHRQALHSHSRKNLRKYLTFMVIIHRS